MKGITSLKDIVPGDLFTTNGKDVWQVTSMCESPTITLKNLESGAEIGGAVGCRNVETFVRLIPEVPIKEVV